MLLSDQLKQSRAAKAEEAQGIYATADTAKRAPTAEEKTKFDGLMTEVKDLNARIDSQLAIEAAMKDTPAKPPVKPVLDKDTTRPVVTFPRSKQLKAFRAHTFGSVQEAEKAAYNSGKWIQAVFTGDPKAMQYCQENGIFGYGTKQVLARDPSPTQIYNVQEEGVNSTGGVLVPDEFERSIIDLREEYGAIRRFAKIVTMNSDTMIRPRRLSGLTAYFVAESAPFTESTKTWDSVTLVAKKAGVLSKYSWELGDDAIIDIADDLSQESAYAFAVLEDRVGFNGTGSGADGGIVGIVTKFINGAATLAGVVNAAATHDNFAEVDGDDIDLLVAKLPLYAHRNARFYVGPVGKALMFDPILRAAGGNTQTDVAGRRLMTYLGYPIEQAVAMPNSATGNYDESPLVLFGDMSLAVTMGVRRGVTIQILKELYAANGQVGVIAWERFDINVHDIGDATNPGPVVALHGETS